MSKRPQRKVAKKNYDDDEFDSDHQQPRKRSKVAKKKFAKVPLETLTRAVKEGSIFLNYSPIPERHEINTDKKKYYLDCVFVEGSGARFRGLEVPLEAAKGRLVPGDRVLLIGYGTAEFIYGYTLEANGDLCLMVRKAKADEVSLPPIDENLPGVRMMVAGIEPWPDNDNDYYPINPHHVSFHAPPKEKDTVFEAGIKAMLSTIQDQWRDMRKERPSRRSMNVKQPQARQLEPEPATEAATPPRTRQAEKEAASPLADERISVRSITKMIREMVTEVATAVSDATTTNTRQIFKEFRQMVADLRLTFIELQNARAEALEKIINKLVDK